MRTIPVEEGDSSERKMINILLEGYDISSLWLLNSLKSYIKSFHRVTVIALAFRETRVENLDDWNYLYEKKGL